MENNEFKDQELVYYYKDDAYRQYVREIIQYPILSREEINKLFDLYQEGDLEARDAIVKSNLRFVIFVARKFAKNLNHLEFLDVVQEGNLGLLRALESYDYNKGAFTTYAFEWIRNYVTRSVANYDDEIRKPIHMKALIGKYYKIINEAEAKNVTLTDEEICEKLNINQIGLDLLRDSFGTRMVSINQTVSNEEGKGEELEIFIGEEDNSMEAVTDKIDSDNLLSIARLSLNDLEYYILYYRYVYNKEVTLDKLAKELNLTRERIRQVEAKLLRKIKLLYKNKKELENKNKELKKHYNKVRIKPVVPDQIIVFNYLCNGLTNEEKELLYYYFFDKFEFNIKEISRIIGFREDKSKEMLDNLLIRVNDALNSSSYLLYKEQMLKQLKGTIYQNGFIHNMDYIDFGYLKDKYSQYTFEELLKLFADNHIYVDKNLYKALQTLHKSNSNKEIDKEELERQLNIYLLGYYDDKCYIDKKKLSRVYVNSMNLFSDEEKMYLECFFFKIRQISEFNYKYNENKMIRSIKKCEKLYYGLNNYSTVSNKTYNTIKDLFLDKFSDQEIKELDNYFANHINTSKVDRDVLDKAIIKLNSLYLENKELIDLAYDKYKSFVINNSNDDILHMYLIQRKSIKEIIELTKETRENIRNEIINGLNHIDRKRYKVFIGLDVFPARVYDVLNKNDKIKSFDRELIIDKYINKISDNDICKKFNVSINTINYVASVFEKAYIDSFTDKEVDARDILFEMNLMGFESTLDTNEKKLIRDYYSGDISRDDIKKKYNLDEYELENILANIKNRIKAKKIGMYNKETSLLSRYEVMRLLKDEHLPLDKEEKSVLMHLYQIDGYPFMSLDDIASSKRINKDQFRESYLDMVVKVKRYDNKENDGLIIYSDFNNYKKYFSDFENLLIDYYYKNNNSYQEIGQNLKIDTNEVRDLINNIEYKLSLLKNGVELFDYSYYKKNIENDNLPYDDDIGEDKEIFDSYYGIKRKSINQLNITTDKDAYDVIMNIKLALCKYKEGFKKNKKITYGDVLKYYKQKKDSMGIDIRRMYEAYLSGLIEMNSIIMCDLIKYKRDNYIDIDSISKWKVLNILKRFDDIISSDIKEGLMNYYNINSDDLIDGEVLQSMYKLLSRLDEKIKSNDSNRYGYKK